MALPDLKPLIRTANHAYTIIREAKEAYRIYNIANYAASFAGYINTSANKKLALEQLANLEIEATTEEKNIIYATRIGELAEHCKDGTYFKSLVEILKSCATLATHPQEGNLIATHSALTPYVNQLRATLNNKHLLFQEIDTFFEEMENYRKEIWRDEIRKLNELLTKAKYHSAKRTAFESSPVQTIKNVTAPNNHTKADPFSLEVHYMWKQISLKKELREKNAQLTQLQQETDKKQKLLTATIKKLKT